MTNAKADTKIEHSGNCVYAIHTAAGPAIYPTLDDLLAAYRSGMVEVHEGNQEYYAGREWLPVSLEEAVSSLLEGKW